MVNKVKKKSKKRLRGDHSTQIIVDELKPEKKREGENRCLSNPEKELAKNKGQYT